MVAVVGEVMTLVIKYLRVAKVAQITESLYSSPSAPTGSQKCLPCVMDDAEASDAVASLFE